MGFRRFVKRLPVALILLIHGFITACTTRDTGITEPSSILDPGGGVALFPADRTSEGVTACVAELLSNQLPNVRIAAGPAAAGMAFGPVAESAPAGRPEERPWPDPLQPEARTRLSSHGIRYIVTVSVRTWRSGSGVQDAPPFFVAALDERSSEGEARVFEAASGKLLIPTHARAHGSVGTVAVFLIPIPFFAFTESRVCHTMGSHLGEIFGGVRAAD